jgi:DNA-binding response OmpR family regulator
MQRILVVEDEPTIAQAVAARLVAEGFEVWVAADGPAAVEQSRAYGPDLLVLDLMLPGFDGLEVCRGVQAERPIPVLMLTARDDETDLPRSRSHSTPVRLGSTSDLPARPRSELIESSHW